jgi:hypothetical protein
MKPKRPQVYSPPRRSGLEDAFEEVCRQKGLLVTYEDTVLSFTTPPQKRRYTPDWTIGPNKFIETKGFFKGTDRKKMLLIKEQHPEVTVYMLFQRASNTLSKRSTTTYGEWCDKNGIIWAEFKDVDTWSKWFITKQLTRKPTK